MINEAVEAAVTSIYDDLDNRSGMEMGQYDSEIQTELKDAWRSIATKLANHVRAETLEEAAKVAQDCADCGDSAKFAAAAIRALGKKTEK